MALQFQPPPDWLIQEYMNRKSPGQELLEGAGQVAQVYLQQKKLQQKNALLQQQMDINNQELALKKTKDVREQGEYAHDYDPSALPGAGGAYNTFSPQDMGPAQPTLTRDAQMRSMLTQQNAPGGFAPTGPAMSGAGPRSPILAHWDSMNGFGMGQNPSLAAAPANPQQQANLDFAGTFPQGLKAVQAQRKSSLDEQFTPEEVNQILAGQPLNRPMSTRGLGRVQQAIGQAGTQERFGERLEQGKREKGAAAELKTGESLRDVQEARATLKQLAKIHGEIVDKGKGGNPVTAWGVGGFAKATGGAYGTDDVLAYNSAVDGMLTRLKTVTGNTGMVTEFDQARIEALAPRLGESKATVKRKGEIINTIFDLVESGEKQKLRTYLDSIGGSSGASQGGAQQDPGASFEPDEEAEYQAWKAGQP